MTLPHNTPPLEEPTRVERMVGEVIGLRMLVSQLLGDIGAGRGDADAYLAETREAALLALDQWFIRGDTPEGADRIGRCAQGMLREFPEPTRLKPGNKNR